MVPVVQRWGTKTSIWVINGNSTIVEISTATRESFIFSAKENIGLFVYSNYMFLKLWPLRPSTAIHHSLVSCLSAPETQPASRSLFIFTGMTLLYPSPV